VDGCDAAGDEALRIGDGRPVDPLCVSSGRRCRRPDDSTILRDE